MPADDAPADESVQTRPSESNAVDQTDAAEAIDDSTAVAEGEVNARTDDPAANARQWLIDNPVATLCTESTRRGLEGYPFGSVVPFALTAEGKPVIFIATIAAHTANLRANNKASLFVREPKTDGDPQNGWRITVMGKMKRLAERNESVSDKDAHLIERVCQDELDAIHARYLETTPWARDYGLTHGFAYWRMSEIDAVRYIGGFGKICWLDGSEVVDDAMAGGLDKASPGAVEHMNEDHANNLIEMVEGLYGFTPASATMTRLDRLGFFVKTEGPERLLHFSFGKIIDAGTLRPAVIDVLKRAREAKAASAS